MSVERAELRGIFYTGAPGVGKSTIFNRLVETLRSYGCKIGGISAPEVRSEGRRIGFLIVDLATGNRGFLAKRGYESQVRVGSYGVVIPDVLRVGVPAIRRAITEADVIGIDEIGPMELAVEELRDAIVRALSSGKPVVGVVHRRLKLRDPQVYRLASSLGPVIEVTVENRDRLASEAVDYAMRVAGAAGCRA